MNLELTRAKVFSVNDGAGHGVDSGADPCTRGGQWALRALGSLLLFLVARPLVGRLNLGR
jgi:hypothetical protein